MLVAVDSSCSTTLVPIKRVKPNRMEDFAEEEMLYWFSVSKKIYYKSIMACGILSQWPLLNRAYAA